MKAKKLFLTAGALLILASCGPRESVSNGDSQGGTTSVATETTDKTTSNESNENTSSSTKPVDENGYRVLDKEDITYKYDTISPLGYGEHNIPNTGEAKVVVVPVNLSGFTKFTSTQLSNIDIAFNGQGTNNKTQEWESVKSFYETSSFGNLSIDFDVVDPMTSSFTKSDFDIDDPYCTTYDDLLDSVYTHLKNKGTLNNYDGDSNGYIDAVWMIYNSTEYSDSEYFWPFKHQYYGNNTSVKNKISVYANCSYYFLTEDSSYDTDTHTLIHETGHLLGLNDYYTYQKNYQQSAQDGFDMMNLNIGDHSAWSKFALGWSSPYIVEDECTITLDASYINGDFIIVPNVFNDSAFGEYVTLEYYQPKGLFERDANRAYEGRPYFINDSGVRISYIDARVAKANYDYSSQSVSLVSYFKENETITESGSNWNMAFVGHENTPSYNFDGEESQYLFSSITTDSLSSIYNRNATTYNTLTRQPKNTSLLFGTNNVFKTRNYSSLTGIFTSGKYHDGTSLNHYEVSFSNETETSIDVTITFVK